MTGKTAKDSRRSPKGNTNSHAHTRRKSVLFNPLSSPRRDYIIRQASLRAEAVAILARRNSSMPLKERAEEGRIVVAHGIADLLDAAVIALEHALGGGDA